MLPKTKIFFINPRAHSRYFSLPLNIAYLAAVAREKNCSVRIMDLAARYASYSDDDLLNAVDSFKPDIVCVPINTCFTRQAFKMASLLEGVDSLKVAGGPHPTARPHECLEQGFDVVVRGEGEETIADLIDFTEGEKKLGEIPGISYKNGNEFFDNPDRPFLENLDKLPFPARDLFKREDYAKSRRESYYLGTISSSRGCPYNCAFCFTSTINGKKIRFRSPENVVAEIEECINSYGINSFLFADSVFTFDRERTIKFCRLVKEKGLDIKWQCSTRVDAVDFELLKEMRAAGCDSILYGVESGSKETLKRIRKAISPERVKKTLSLTNQAGINPNTHLVLGFPWETAESTAKTRKFIEEISPMVKFFIPSNFLIPFPETAIFEEFKDENSLEGWWNKSKKGDYFFEAEELPIFHKVFYNHIALTHEIFFHYPDEVKEELMKIINFMILHNLKQDSSILSFYVAISTFHLSRILFSISPKLEIKLFKLIRRIKDISH